MGFKTHFVVSSMMLLAGVSGWADDAATSDAEVNATKMQNPANSSTEREDIDKEITNKLLRAETGAKSLWSIQTAFTYNGGSVENPLGEQRPQLSPGTIENDPSKITGTVAVKYRMTDHDNLNLGIGLGWVTPTYSGEYGQIEDPYVAYDRLFKWGDVQNVLNVQMTKYTADSSIARGDAYQSDIDHTFLITVPKSKWQVGVDIGWTHDFYTSLGGVQDVFAAYPYAEYPFNDTLNFRTVYRGLTYFNSTAAANTFQRDDATQSLGLGISVTRDMYFYPNVQWVWADVQTSKTNVALTAYINM